jgi:hypothetical protein
MGRDGRPNEPASAMAKHQEPEELLKRHRGDHKEINRRDPLRMIAKEGFPGNGRPCLGTMYFDTVDWATSMPMSNSPWILGPPERVLKAHSSDQVANLLIDPRSATERAGLPSPVSGEPHSVPAHDRLGPDDGYGIQDARKAAIKPNEQNPIGPTQIQSTRRAPSKHGQLMAQNHNFGLKPRSRLEAVAQQADAKEGNCDHQSRLCCDSPTAANRPDGVFGSDSRFFAGGGLDGTAPMNE